MIAENFSSYKERVRDNTNKHKNTIGENYIFNCFNGDIETSKGETMSKKQ